MATFYGGYNKYIQELSSSGGSIYDGLGGGDEPPKKLIIGLGVVAAIVVGLNIMMYMSSDSSSSSSQSQSRRSRRNRRQ